MKTIVLAALFAFMTVFGASAQDVTSDKVLAPDFTLMDNNLEKFTLSSLRGKYVVLDFWGTWCGWCIKGFPKMREYYDKYKDKYEIVSIDCGDKQEKWLQYVDSLALPWINVFQDRTQYTIKVYGVRAFPTKILIDPEGYIVATMTGERPEFYELLDTTFGDKKKK